MCWLNYSIIFDIRNQNLWRFTVLLYLHKAILLAIYIKIYGVIVLLISEIVVLANIPNLSWSGYVHIDFLFISSCYLRIAQENVCGGLRDGLWKFLVQMFLFKLCALLRFSTLSTNVPCLIWLSLEPYPLINAVVLMKTGVIFFPWDIEVYSFFMV